MPAGTKLWRIHSCAPDRHVLTLNPSPADPIRGGRFDSPDGSYRYSYFGDDISVCIAETYCRSLPLDDTVPRILRRRKLEGRVLSQVQVTTEFPVALLHGRHLAAIGQDLWLTKSDPVDYPRTRQWAAAVVSGTDARGIKYRARNDEDCFSIVMTIRADAAPPVELGDLMKVVRDPIPLDDAAGLELVRSHLAVYNATLR
ncbi:RES family NAD+ phosphorylase [Rhodococcus sp. NPDC058481]|uniref:RES family NAD+ phosphorylase n=1 Tax=unclassified Rhodococcus (in: high G+C Gram-positive bacteria) TaxID=192944 RepID=UPI00364BBB93